MSEITAEMVRDLREATNVSMMECKRALAEAGGDKDKAIKILRERGVAVAAKKAARAANQGLVGAVVVQNGLAGALVEVNCETDFVARNDAFRKFVQDMAAKAAESDGPLADRVKEAVVAKVQEVGENIVVRRDVRYQVQGTGLVAVYVHLGGKIGVMVEVGAEKSETVGHPAFRELAKDLTLHIAASSPRYLDRSGVAADVAAAEREIYAKQVQNKPPQVLTKIVDGKMGKFYQQICLVEQGFVKDPEKSVTEFLAAKAKELGDKLVIRRFTRYQLGE